MDREAVKAFMEDMVEKFTHTAVVGVLAVADRTGLLRAMAGAGPVTVDQVAETSGLQERYVREALSALAASEIVVHNAPEGTFELPDEHAVCLVDESNPYFLGGWAQGMSAMLEMIPRVAAGFGDGGGVAFSEYGPELVTALDRMNGPAIRTLFVRKWLPEMPDVVAALEAGARVADVGCGSGAAAIALAAAFPDSTVVGYDIDASSLGRARAAAEAEEVGNVEFVEIAAEDLADDPGFEFIMSFDAIHDMGDPRAALVAIRRALRPGGTYLMVEPNAAATLDENLNPIGALMYSISTLHCLPVSLAAGSVGLGTAWGPEQAEQLSREAGFSGFERLPIDNPTNAFYRLG